MKINKHVRHCRELKSVTSFPHMWPWGYLLEGSVRDRRLWRCPPIFYCKGNIWLAWSKRNWKIRSVSKEALLGHEAGGFHHGVAGGFWIFSCFIRTTYSNWERLQYQFMDLPIAQRYHKIDAMAGRIFHFMGSERGIQGSWHRCNPKVLQAWYVLITTLSQLLVGAGTQTKAADFLI